MRIIAVDDEMLVKNPFDFHLANVVVNDSVKREALSLADETGSLWYATQGATTRGVRMLPSVRFVKRAKLCVSGSGVVAWGESELSGCEKGKVR